MPPLHPKTELLEYFIKVGDGSRPVFQSVEMFDEKEERSIVTEVVCPESHVWWPRRHDPKALVEAFQAKRLPEAIRVAQIDHPKGGTVPRALSHGLQIQVPCYCRRSRSQMGHECGYLPSTPSRGSGGGPRRSVQLVEGLAVG